LDDLIFISSGLISDMQNTRAFSAICKQYRSLYFEFKPN